MRDWRSRLRRPDTCTLAYALVVASGLLLDITGALHVYHMGVLMGQKLALVAAAVLMGVAFGWVLVAIRVVPAPAVSPTPTSSPAPVPAPVTPWFLPFLLLLAWLATWYDIAAFIAPAQPVTFHLLAVGLVVLFGAALVRPLPPGLLLVGAVAGGVAARAVGVASVPIDPARDDMLPLVQGALTNLLHGHSPYTIYHMPWELPLTYLPLTWLAYLPPFAAGLDIRLSNLFAELFIGGALVGLAAVQRHRTTPHRRAAWHALWHEERGLLLWAWLFLQPSSLHWFLSTTAPVFWVLLAWLLVWVLAGRHWLAAVTLGLCAAASPLVSVVAPFVLLHWLHTKGWRVTLLSGVLAGVVAAVWVVPFALWSPQAFVYGTWHWFNDNDLYPRLRWDMDNTWASMVGVSGVFWRRSLEWVLKPIQAVWLVGLLVVCWRGRATAHQIAPLVAAAFLLFVVFNPVLWPYLYTPSLVAALVAVVSLEAFLNHR